MKTFKCFFREWVEYNFRYGEDLSKVKRVLKKLRKKFNLPDKLPGDI